MLFLMEILRSAASMSWCCFFLSSALRMFRSPVIGMAWVASGAILKADLLKVREESNNVLCHLVTSVIWRAGCQQ